MNFPKLVIRLQRRAICPSKKSVMRAAIKMISVIQFCPGMPSVTINATTKNGISTMCAIVNLFGGSLPLPP